MLKIPNTIIVEGKYDREKILSAAQANVITTDGFGIFKEAEKAAFLRRLAEKNPVIVMTDSDGAGLVIRNYIHSVLPKDKIIDIYTPEIAGKEKRKKAPSKAGILGVEGMKRDWVEAVLMPFSSGEGSPEPYITKTDFYLLGLSGGDESAQKRKVLAGELGLPGNLSCSALINAINLLIPRENLLAAIEKISDGKQNG